MRGLWERSRGWLGESGRVKRAIVVRRASPHNIVIPAQRRPLSRGFSVYHQRLEYRIVRREPCQRDGNSANRVRAMTHELGSRSRPRCAEVAIEFLTLSKPRAPGMTDARCTAISAQWHRKCALSITGQRRTFRQCFFLRTMAYGLTRALPGERRFAPSPLRKRRFFKLDAKHRASGQHDFAVRFSTVSRQHLPTQPHTHHPPHPPPPFHRIPPRANDDLRNAHRIGTGPNPDHRRFGAG